MKPSEIYDRIPEEETYDLYNVKTCFTDLYTTTVSDSDVDERELNKKILTKTVKYYSFDGRRIWEVLSVWFENKPFMISMNAGREGRDDSRLIITNKQLYADASSYLVELMLNLEKEDIKEINPDEDCDDLECFYGHSVEIMLNLEKE